MPGFHPTTTVHPPLYKVFDAPSKPSCIPPHLTLALSNSTRL